MPAAIAPRDPASEVANITLCLGPDAAKYASNKVRGGSNGRKGTRYEDFFAAHKVAEIAIKQMAALSEWPIIEDQAFAFVDDLVLTTQNQAKYHQLKNVGSLGWTNGDHPIAIDFSHQVALSKQRGDPPTVTTLVVSNPSVFDDMRQTVPSAIAGHSTVEFFPYADGSFNRLVIEYGPLRAALSELTRVPEPGNDDLANVFGVLMLGAIKAGSPATVDQVIKAAQDVSPALLRLFPWDLDGFSLEPGFVNALARVPGLLYGVERGFFRWAAANIDMSGVLQFNCLSREFQRFQANVTAAAPTDFDSFEKLLP
jgi:hypothetical protein